VLIRISIAFVIGAMLHRIYLTTRGGTLWAVLAPLSVAAVCALTYAPSVLSVVYLVPLGVLILSLAHGGGILGVLLSTRPFVWGGLVSYSFYMIHGQIVQIFGAVLFDRLPDQWFLSAALAVGCLAFVVICAAALFYFVEEPSRKLIRGEFRQRVRTSTEP
jgi:peptidoglycan/LPS O-acetylase OafA/YrhL